MRGAATGNPRHLPCFPVPTAGDRQGVLATVAGVFAKHEVSIATVRQSGREEDAKLVIVTHGAPDANLAATVESLSRLDIVRSIASVLRVEGGV